MYKIYPLDPKYVSPLISFREFLTKSDLKGLMNNVPQEPCTSESERIEKVREIMAIDVTDAYFNSLIDYCRPENVTDDPNFNPLGSRSTTLEEKYCSNKYEPIPIDKNALHLETISSLTEHLNIEKKRNRGKYTSKYSSEVYLDRQITSPTGPPDLIPGQELLITIRIFFPIKIENVKLGKRALKYLRDVVVLGSQTLDKLRDRIWCPTFLAVKDISENPKQIVAMDVCKSGFFFIEDVFYNDTRDPNNIDYSKCIREWTKDKDDISPLKTAIMEETKFIDLGVHLGYPQLYKHCGHCEHLFIFADVKILQSTDICHSSLYPYTESIASSKNKYCDMCSEYVAKWVVEESIRIPIDPAYFCDVCFNSYNYIDGKKIGSFKAHPFREPNAVL